MTRAVAVALAGALALVSLSACGSTHEAGRGAGPTSSASTTATPPTTKGANPMPDTPTGPPENFTVPTKGAKHVTVRVRGTVSDGVEPGCTLLTSKGVVYRLLWREGTPLTGTEIEVEGTIQHGLMSTCQQGTPLVVKRILSP
jgi:hypothetical protein